MGFKVIQILLFFGFCMSSFPHHVLRQYHYVNLQMNWYDAQLYCREKYSDLATFESMEDINRLNKPSLDEFRAWIGLNDDPKFWKGTISKASNSWRWSATGEISKTGYEPWKPAHPNSDGLQYCVLMDDQSKWYNVNCGVPNQFICYTATNQTEKSYVFIPTRKGWSAARDYCRAHHTDLAMIENNEENIQASKAKPYYAVAWIGLYREAWMWSDNSNSPFRNWASGQPQNNEGDEFCVFEKDAHKWDDMGCWQKQSVLCHQDPTVQTTMSMKIETDADLTDPATTTQMLQKLAANLTSQGWTDVKLQWKTEPRKQEKEKLTEPPCV